MRRLLPNAITVGRLLLLPVFVWSVLDARPPLATVLLLTMAFSDVLDGYLARRWHAETRMGALLDPLADKLTQLTGLVVLAYAAPPDFPRIPRLFVALVLARDALLAYGAVRIRLGRGRVHIRARWEGKASTLLIFVLLCASCVRAPEWVVLGLAIAAAPLVVAAGVHYTIDGRKQIAMG